jgi:hypothetical protein
MVTCPSGLVVVAPPGRCSAAATLNPVALVTETGIWQTNRFGLKSEKGSKTSSGLRSALLNSRFEEVAEPSFRRDSLGW